MDTDTVVVASAICEGKHMDLRISELPGVYDNIESKPGSPCPKPGDVLHVPNLCSFVDDGLKGPSPGFGDTSDLPVSVSVVVSGPGPPGPELRDTLGLPDFSSDIDPGPGSLSRGPGVYWHGRSSYVPLRRIAGGLCQNPEMYRIGRVLK